MQWECYRIPDDFISLNFVNQSIVNDKINSPLNLKFYNLVNNEI